MATNTYVALQKTTVSGSSTSTVTLSSIPQGYTDLVLVFEGTESANQYIAFQVNSDTGSNYSWTRMYGDGSTAYSSQGNSVTFGRLGIGDPSSGRTITTSHFMNYSNSTTYKSILSRSSGGGFVGSLVNLWRSTAAITSITILTTTSDTFTSGSTFSLYGVASEGASAKATGGIITSDANYFYHTFLSSGTFTPTTSLTADYLVVAGGGGAASSNTGLGGSGGGGAGGYRTSIGGSALSLSATAYTVTVGAGGAGGTASSNTNGTKGSNSVFSSITSTGGGFSIRCGNPALGSSGTGGSGGGGSWYKSPKGTGNEGGFSPVEGYNGGENLTTTNPHGAGGGGAGAVGGNQNGTGGAGGIGSNSASAFATATGTGVSGYYAGGGGGAIGGAGGTGGGGAGGSALGAAGTDGTANTGGGGGGTYANGGKGGTGGSGIVIVRYAR